MAGTLPGCAWLSRDGDAAPEAVAAADSGTTVGAPSEQSVPQPIINPEVERREIKRAKIDTEDFEIGIYGGILSIEDFESHPVYGARLAYHLTEDFFLEAT
ncbi:MAG TPA: hypothetical protein VIT67_07955, partial [Povalibacter sp.]